MKLKGHTWCPMYKKNLLVDFWNEHFLLCDFLFATTIWVFFTIWLFFLKGTEQIGFVISPNHNSIYETISAIQGALLGFIITTVSVIIGYSNNERLVIVVENENYKDLWFTFTQTIKFLAVSTLVSLSALVINSSQIINWVLFSLTFYFSLIVIVRLTRCIQIFEKVIKILITPIKK
jgi:hypothetical protein